MNQHPKTVVAQSSRTLSSKKIGMVSAAWHKEIVDRAVHSATEAFLNAGIPKTNLEYFEVPGAFEIPLHAKRLAETGKYEAIIAFGLVVNGGIYRHEFVASAVIDGLMQVQLSSEVPVFSAVLTPHHYHGHAEHSEFFAQHFVAKGKEVASACMETLASLESLARECA